MRSDYTYTYVIDSISESSRTMTVTYTTEGKAPFTVCGVRLPRQGESLENIIRSAAPVPFWMDEDTPLEGVQSGASGVVSVPVGGSVQDAAQDIALWRSLAQISMRQCRLHLLQTGKLELVQPAIDSMPEPTRTAANIEWEYGSVVRRDSPLVAQLAPVLEWTTPEAIDQEFIAAAQL
jgi:hypothetical protein